MDGKKSRRSKGSGGSVGDSTHSGSGRSDGIQPRPEGGGDPTGGGQHGKKKSWHNNPEDRHPCICGYATCADILSRFCGTGHTYDRAPIRLSKASDPRYDTFQASLLRNLHVPVDERKKIIEARRGYRYSVCAHHFTETVIIQYVNNPKQRGIWKVQLDRKEATAVLHVPLDPLDVHSGKYFINANQTIEEAESILAVIESGRGERAAVKRKAEDEEKKALRMSLEKKNKAAARDKAELDRLQQEVSKLTREKESLKRKDRRAKKTKEELASENEQLKEAPKLTLEDVTRILIKVGGMSRLTLFDRSWHEDNPEAAKCLFGFNTYNETLVYIKCFFPDVDIDQLPGLEVSKKKKQKSNSHRDPIDDVKMPPLRAIEKCLLCRLFFRRELSEQFIGLVFNKHRTTIGSVLKEWAPRWGKAGEQCSILDIVESFLESEEPDRSKEVGVRKAVLVDGADTGCEKNRSNPTANAILYSPKNNEQAARGLTWSTAGGLTFEHSPMVGARCSEKRLYRFCGSLGVKKAPVEEWEDVANGLSDEQKICRLELGTDKMFDYHDIEEEIETIKVFSGDAAPIESDVLLTATDEGMKKLRPGQSRASSSKAKDERIPTLKDIDEWFTECCAMENAAKKSDKKSPKLKAATLEQQGEEWLKGGVNSSGLEKLAQLEVHERLHRAYESKKLKKTALSFFLLHAKDDRHKLLKWMGSSLAPANVQKPRKEELPAIWLRLAKIPPGWSVLGDKGFEKATRLNPRLNHVRTPWKLSDSQIKDYRRSAEMIGSDRETSHTRAPAEDNFERYRNEDILKHRVPYWVIAMLPFVHEWAHANMNLQDPIRRPGSDNMIELTEDYWDKHLDN